MRSSRRHASPRWLVSTLFCALALGLVSCALPPRSAAPPAAHPAAATTQASSTTTEWEQTLAAAKREGTVTVAGPPQPAEREVLMGFREAYPDIKLEYSGLIGGQFSARVATERSTDLYAWDLFIGGASEQYSHIPAGWNQPLKPAVILPEVLDDSKWMGGFDAGFGDAGRQFVYGFTWYITNLLKVNRTSIPESELNTAEGLLDPKWRGRIVVYDPRAGGAGLLAFSALRRQLGDEAIRKILVDQQPVFSTDKRQFTEWVVRGRYPIGIGVVDPYLAPFWEEGLGKDVGNLRTRVEVLTPGSGNLVLMDRAPHPNATKVFVNWLLSAETQTIWARQAATNSRRLDVPSGSPETKPDPARMADYVDFNSEIGNPFMRDTQTFTQQIVP
jgi:iron(III) transport system substrate-binding protein